jgi:hypothetical protein
LSNLQLKAPYPFTKFVVTALEVVYSNFSSLEQFLVNASAEVVDYGLRVGACKGLDSFDLPLPLTLACIDG